MAGLQVYYYANGADTSHDPSYSTGTGHEMMSMYTAPDPVSEWGWTYDGKVFSHWNVEPDDSSVTIEVGQEPAGLFTLYAIWQDAAGSVHTLLTKGKFLTGSIVVTVSGMD